MNVFTNFDPQVATVVGFGVRCLLISAETNNGPIARKLAGLGCRVEICDEVYSALDQVIEDPSEFELIVIDCDSSGGFALGQRAHALLKVTQRCIPMMLVSKECVGQVFPMNRHEPTLLRAPLSSVSLRVGFEHVMQERMLMARAI
jgi:hypothetical protein